MDDRKQVTNGGFEMQVKLPNNVTISEKQSITIVGANGSGKTRLSVWIEQNNTDKNVHRISAQKSLSMPESVQPSSLDRANDEFLYGTTNDDESWKKTYGKTSNRWHSKPEIVLLNDYDKLMQLLFTEDYQKSQEFRVEHRELQNKEFDNETILDKTKCIFEELLPHRKLKIEAGCIKVGTNSISYYNGAEMSDGEREIFYFIASVYAVPQNSIIIVDEPENHLHNSILNKLWNSLEKSRKDCLFIYITHNLDFAVSRINSQLIWVKSYLGDKKWQFELIEDNSIPESLQVQVLGNRQNVLFVEGNSNSYDIKLYNILFDCYNIIPVEGCDKVIHYTTSINENPQLNYISAKGIIDKDRRNDLQINNYREKNIYIPKVTEIENIFLLPQIIKAVSYQLKKSEEETTQIITEVQKKVLDYLKTHKEEQALLYTKSKIDNELELLKKSKSTNLASYEQELKNSFETIDFNSIHSKFINQIDGILLNNIYEDAICLINNKGLIQESGLTTKLGLKQSNYIELALKIIRDNEELQDYIKQYINIV